MKKILFVTLLVGLPTFALADDKTSAKGKGTVVTIDGLTSTTPAEWKETPPPEKFAQMRVKQFLLPKVGDDKHDAELVISFFGTGGGGGLDANITRWQGMMTPPAGKSGDDAFKVTKMKVGSVPVVYVDASGTYKGAPFEKITPRADYRMIRIYFDSKNGPYFIGLVGPAKTVASHKDAFDKWLMGFKGS